MLISSIFSPKDLLELTIASWVFIYSPTLIPNADCKVLLRAAICAGFIFLISSIDFPPVIERTVCSMPFAMALVPSLEEVNVPFSKSIVLPWRAAA